MTTSDTMPCPHCGGEIKSAAQLCKHCKRAVNQPVAGNSPEPVASPGAAAKLPAVVEDLRDFLVSRKTTTAAVFDQAVTPGAAADASIALGHLASQSVIAPAQVDAIREAFRSAQVQRARTLLEKAVKQGLLQPQQAEQGLAGFANEALAKTPKEYLVGMGLLTAAQAEQAGGTDLVSSLREKMKSPKLVAIGIAALLVPASLCLWLASGEPDIMSEPTVNRLGHGDVSFTNTGTAAGSKCGRIMVTCSAGTKNSTHLCSGEIEPGESTSVDFSVAEMDRILPRYGDWRDDCNLMFWSVE